MEAPSFHHLGEPPRRRGASKRKKVLVIVISIIAFFVLAGGVEAYAGYRAYTEAMTGRAAALAAADEIKSLNFSAAAIHLHDAEQHFAAAKNYMKPLAPLTVMPVVGPPPLSPFSVP